MQRKKLLMGQRKRRIHIRLKFSLIKFHSVNNHRVLLMRVDILTESIFLALDLVLLIKIKFKSREEQTDPGGEPFCDKHSL